MDREGYSNFFGLSRTITRAPLKGSPYLIGRELLLGLDIDRFRMAVEDRDPDRGGGHTDRIVFHDLFRLIDHLYLFFSVPVVKEDIDVGKAVKAI